MSERVVGKETPANIAATLFAQVSRDFPATVAFQATAIARACASQRLIPQTLGLALLNDKGLVRKLTDVANTVHIARSVTDQDGKPIKPRTIEDTEGIIDSDFALAGAMMKVPDAERAEFLGLYPAYRQTVRLIGIDDAETIYRFIATQLINKHEKSTQTATKLPGPTYSTSASGLVVVNFDDNGY